MIKKSIKEISWQITEEEYRKDPAISYSTLSTFAREGPKCIPNLGEKKESAALRFGSLVDCLLTEPETVSNRFVFSEFPNMSETVLDIIKNLWEECGETHRTLEKIPFDMVLCHIDSIGYQPRWKPETRVRDIIEKGSAYYKLLALSENKILMSNDDFAQAQACVHELKTNPFTMDHFVPNPLVDYMEHKFQLKFKLCGRSSDINAFNETRIRCMFDLLLVDHKEKTIRPCDLKTTGKEEECFEDSFIQWRYDIQSNLYSFILSEVCKKDEYFKDFKILPFTFICINKYCKAPILWEDLNSLIQGDRVNIANNTILKGWQRLLKELYWHMETKEYKYTYDTFHNKGVRFLSNIRIKGEFE